MIQIKISDIWSIIASNYPELKPNNRSKDISLYPIETNDLTITVVIHHTDKFSVIVGCSLRPVILDIGGLIRLSNALTRVEERLSRLLEGSNYQSLSVSSPKSPLIPEELELVLVVITLFTNQQATAQPSVFTTYQNQHMNTDRLSC